MGKEKRPAVVRREYAAQGEDMEAALLRCLRARRGR